MQQVYINNANVQQCAATVQQQVAQQNARNTHTLARYNNVAALRAVLQNYNVVNYYVNSRKQFVAVKVCNASALSTAAAHAVKQHALLRNYVVVRTAKNALIVRVV